MSLWHSFTDQHPSKYRQQRWHWTDQTLTVAWHLETTERARTMDRPSRDPTLSSCCSRRVVRPFVFCHRTTSRPYCGRPPGRHRRSRWKLRLVPTCNRRHQSKRIWPFRTWVPWRFLWITWLSTEISRRFTEFTRSITWLNYVSRCDKISLEMATLVYIDQAR